MTDPDPRERHGRMRRLVRGWTVTAFGGAALAAGGLTVGLAQQAGAETGTTVTQDETTVTTSGTTAGTPGTTTTGTSDDPTSSAGATSDGSADDVVTGGAAPRAGTGSPDTGSGGS